jgi:hypothetical protein
LVLLHNSERNGKRRRRCVERYTEKSKKNYGQSCKKES